MDGPRLHTESSVRMDARDALGEPTAYVSRSALLHNAAVLRRAVGPRTKICAIVKANAFGHDADVRVGPGI